MPVETQLRHRRWLIASATTMTVLFSLHCQMASGQKPHVQGQDLFNQRCAACHTVGGGAKTGPDLAVVRDWKKPAIRKNIERMQARAGKLTGDEVDALVEYLTLVPAAGAAEKIASSGKSAAAAPPPDDEVVPPMSANEIKAAGAKMTPEEKALMQRFSPPPGFKPPAPRTKLSQASNDTAAKTESAESGPGDWQSQGAQLYSGRQPLQNGGVQCSACHLQKDSRSAPDLSEIAGEKKGSKLLQFLSAPGNRAMKEAYEKHPITEAEAAALSSYFGTISESESKDGKGEHTKKHKREGKHHRDREGRGDDD